MKNNKGFTLVEIIVSIALLGIICVGLFSGLTLQYRLMKSTQSITSDVAGAQQQMELEISDVKKAIQDGTASSSDEKSYPFHFISDDGMTYDCTVSGYPKEIEVSLGNSTRKLYTVIADHLMPEFAVASATITIEFSDGVTLDFAYIDTPSLYVKSNVTIDDPENVNMTNIYRWYVSRAGFNIPMISNPSEIENGTVYPRFPDDYTIISGANSANLTSISSKYAGRHLICTVTPAAQSGKMGATAVSNPVYLSGLPVTSDLRLHLDASMISKEDTDAVNGTDTLTVEEWYDISGNGDDAVQSDAKKQPVLNETYIGDIVDNNLRYETYAKYVSFDGDSINGYNDLLTSKVGSFSGEKTVFVVARYTGEDDFTIYQDDEVPGFVSFGSNKAYIGGTSDEVDIAEVIVYDGVLSEDDADEVRSYLENKYFPVAPELTIRSLVPVTATVMQGDAYTPPSTVQAYMSNGQLKNVAVTWSPDTIDTSEAGVKYSTASAVADPTKTTTLTVYIAAPVRVTGVTLNKNSTSMEMDGSETLIATVSPSDATNQNVAWSSSDTDIATVGQNGRVTGVSPGTVTITVTTEDGGYTDTCIVTVTTVSVTGVSLNKETTTLYKNSSETLTATVSPSNAYNKNVTWSSSNTSIVTVNASGKIQSGSNRGTAVITVTTADGGYTDTCTVYVVNKKVTGVTLNKDSISLETGKSQTLTATVSPWNADVQTVTWMSSNSSIASVDSSGKVTAGSTAGTAVITVTTNEGGFTDTCQVTVTADTTPPAVTKLGDGWSDYYIPGYSSRYLVFSEELSDASKTAVEAALTSGCSKSLSFSWNGATLTITRNGSSYGWFNNDVSVTITDLAGNSTTNALLIDSSIY